MNFQEFDNQVNPKLSFLNNEYVTLGLSVFLVLYAHIYAPKLPANIVSILETPIVRGILLFLVVYLLKKSPSIALIVAVCVVLVVLLLSKYGEHMTDLPGCGYGCGCGTTCRCGKDCPCGKNNCPCLKMRHQYASYEPFADAEGKPQVEEEKVNKILSEIVPVKVEEAKVNQVLSELNQESKKHEILSEIKQEIQPVKVEEAKVNAVIAEVEEKKRELSRDLSAEELKSVCADVSRRFEILPPTGDEFDEESLSALREKVAHRKQNTAVGGFDNSVVYASL